jgi:hypothetical protein
MNNFQGTGRDRRAQLTGKTRAKKTAKVRVGNSIVGVDGGP